MGVRSQAITVRNTMLLNINTINISTDLYLYVTEHFVDGFNAESEWQAI